MKDILYCLNLNLSMHVRVGSRSAITFKIKLSVTTGNSSFQPLPIFCHKDLHLKSLHRARFEYCNMIHKNSSRYWGHPHLRLRSSATLWKYENLTLLDAVKIHFQRPSALIILHLISNRLNGININSLT